MHDIYSVVIQTNTKLINVTINYVQIIWYG